MWFYYQQSNPELGDLSATQLHFRVCASKGYSLNHSKLSVTFGILSTVEK